MGITPSKLINQLKISNILRDAVRNPIVRIYVLSRMQNDLINLSLLKWWDNGYTVHANEKTLWCYQIWGIEIKLAIIA